MDQNNPLQNYFNNNAQPIYSDYFPATSNCEQPQQPVFSFLNNDPAMQFMSYAPQYTDQNISPSLNSLNNTSYTTSNCEQPQQPVFSFSNSEHAQSLSYAPQYTDQNISPPLSSLNNTSYTTSNYEQQQLDADLSEDLHIKKNE
jgi:hypothetical protein